MQECPHCNKQFKKKGISSHLKFCKLKPEEPHQVPAATDRRLSISMPPPPPPECSKCHKGFKTVQAVRTHEKFCTGKPERVVAPSRRLSTTLPVNNGNHCHICGDNLPTPTGLKVHLLTHKT